MIRRSKAAQQYFIEHLICEHCGDPASDVHHIVTRGSGGEEEGWNFLSLCMTCHQFYHDRGWRTFVSVCSTTLCDKIVAARERQGKKVCHGYDDRPAPHPKALSFLNKDPEGGE